MSTSCTLNGNAQYNYAVQQGKAAVGNDICTVPNVNEGKCQDYCSNNANCTHYEFAVAPEAFMTCGAGDPCCYLKSGTPNYSTRDNHNVGVRGSKINGGSGGSGSSGGSGLLWIFIIIGVLLIGASFWWYKVQKNKATAAVAKGGDNIWCGHPQNPYYTGAYGY